MQIAPQPGHRQKEPISTGKDEAEPHPTLVRGAIVDPDLPSSG